MSSLFQNVKNVFSTGPDPNDPAVKLAKEVDGMELKKQALVSAVQNEIQAARQQINGILLHIGGDVYNAHKSGSAVEDKLAGQFDEIKALEDLIAEKNTKIEDISARYDDEIAILRTSLGTYTATSQPDAAPAPAPAPASGGGAFCEKCGKPFTPGENAFCVGCGQKLQ